MKITRQNLHDSAKLYELKPWIIAHWYTILWKENGRRQLVGIYEYYQSVIEWMDIIDDWDYRKYVKFFNEVLWIN